MKTLLATVASTMFAASLGFAGPAIGETLTWTIRSDYPYIVSLEFYSQKYDLAWPGGDEVYILDDSDVHEYILNCEYGESICFGAWVRGDTSLFWGVGRGGTEYCSDCCYTCGYGDTDLRILNP